MKMQAHSTFTGLGQWLQEPASLSRSAMSSPLPGLQPSQGPRILAQPLFPTPRVSLALQAGDCRQRPSWGQLVSRARRDPLLSLEGSWSRVESPLPSLCHSIQRCRGVSPQRVPPPPGTHTKHRDTSTQGHTQDWKCSFCRMLSAFLSAVHVKIAPLVVFCRFHCHENILGFRTWSGKSVNHARYTEEKEPGARGVRAEALNAQRLLRMKGLQLLSFSLSLWFS